MSTNVSVNNESVTVELKGIDAVLALKHRLTIPLKNVASASIVSVAEAKRNLGLRIGGGYFPGQFATGNFLSRRGMKGRQFWSVYRDAEVLQIDLKDGGLRRVVLQTPDRVALASAISARTNHQ